MNIDTLDYYTKQTTICLGTVSAFCVAMRWMWQAVDLHRPQHALLGLMLLSLCVFLMNLANILAANRELARTKQEIKQATFVCQSSHNCKTGVITYRVIR